MATEISKATEVLISLALDEDLDKHGDITSTAFVDKNRVASGSINSREPCVVAGLDICAHVFTRVDPAIAVEILLKSGDQAGAGDAVITLSGSAQSILAAERTALNFLQRLSGIATMTRSFVDVVQGTGVKILDTRKTTPGWRELEKAAVISGGGHNHRMGLYDMAMVKDNHLLAAGTMEDTQKAIDALKTTHPDARIEIEADNLDQVERFLQLRGVDVILLDNMDPAQMRQAASMERGNILLEASGNINLTTLKEVSASGIDMISVGSLTHSFRSIDFGLDFQEQ
ncbi:MAG: carboxylating nicotinate-nucleotide diphosphorylase [Verrucomicrobiaceae bacterium]|nr:carboxylating nicotinate-nucleotide diphosphorylase [Verrucomicrobiaceae bacterium]